jgi:hypothetical protein
VVITTKTRTMHDMICRTDTIAFMLSSTLRRAPWPGPALPHINISPCRALVNRVLTRCPGSIPGFGLEEGFSGAQNEYKNVF